MSPITPAKLTLWKWLGRAVQEGRVLQSGRGNRRDPFLYELPGMVEKWQQKFLESFTKRLEQDEKGQGPDGIQAPPSGDNEATPAVPVVRPEEATIPLDPVPLPERKPETPASASPSPDPSPSRTPDPLAPPPEASVRLPYPWSLMNPAEVPEEVWQRARAAKRNG